jgi:hypothetical protein
VVLALVVNPEVFIKYSSVLEGNMADSKTLEAMIHKLRIKTSVLAEKALVIIDAGIATEEILKMIRAKGYQPVRESFELKKLPHRSRSNHRYSNRQ